MSKEAECPVISYRSLSFFGLLMNYISNFDFHFCSLQEAWYLRAILELHIDYKLGAQIDKTNVCNFSTTGVMNEYRQKLIEVLSSYNPSKPFQYIDDVIEEVELNTNENCIVRCVLKNDYCDYFLLLSNAVISVMVK
ncbi:hypothetical protein LOAG_15687 [Loa loa]|uniref:Uncharacterized protein n=1 Tax=Loa loa TaxID=7209 RepID=A0A1S0TFY7_LOALO|nr:hypothetical protein LOAG_15687 [Loa loa]EFO12846.1 hypothetical protein LOAG_15687 [Loa loa]